MLYGITFGSKHGGGHRWAYMTRGRPAHRSAQPRTRLTVRPDRSGIGNLVTINPAGSQSTALGARGSLVLATAGLDFYNSGASSGAIQ